SHVLCYPGATFASRARRLRIVGRQVMPLSLRRSRARRALGAPSWLRSEFQGLARELILPAPPERPFQSRVERNTWNPLASPYSARTISSLQFAAMMAGKEYRFPFLDRDLAHHVLQVPRQYFPRPAGHPRLHREIVAGLLPERVASRQGKADFTPALKARVRAA